MEVPVHRCSWGGQVVEQVQASDGNFRNNLESCGNVACLPVFRLGVSTEAF